MVADRVTFTNSNSNDEPKAQRRTKKTSVNNSLTSLNKFKATGNEYHNEDPQLSKIIQELSKQL